jgi:hypothetical protein
MGEVGRSIADRPGRAGTAAGTYLSTGNEYKQGPTFRITR